MVIKFRDSFLVHSWVKKLLRSVNCARFTYPNVVYHWADNEQDLDIPALRVTDVNGGDLSSSPPAASNNSSGLKAGKQHVTSTMSRISGVRKLKHSNSLSAVGQPVPTYGVDSDKPAEMSKVITYQFHTTIQWTLVYLSSVHGKPGPVGYGSFQTPRSITKPRIDCCSIYIV